MKYEALTTPFKIGNVEIRNRFVMLPMTIEKTDNYAIGDDLIDFYEQRAIGGAGRDRFLLCLRLFRHPS